MATDPFAPLLGPSDWSFPIPIHYGPGRIAELGARCAALGSRRPLLVTDRGSAELPFVEQALDVLASAGLQGSVFSDVSPNPTDHDLQAGRRVARSGGHDGIVAIGGGSGMDAGKALSLIAANDNDLWAFDYDHAETPTVDATGFLPLVTVPTTAGTGAETESTAMVTDTEAGIKRCVWHPDHRPAATILDPALTLGLPPNLTAWTGVDALVHAIEALLVPTWHPLCDGLAVEAARLIGHWLPIAVDDGASLEARGAMLAGSCLAGISFLKGLGLVHAISHMVGAVYDTHHGLTNAILLPSVLRFNEEAMGEKTARLTRALSLPTDDFGTLEDAIVGLLDRLEIPTGLAAIGVGDDRVHELAVKARGDAAAGTNPVAASVAQIEALISSALHRAR